MAVVKVRWDVEELANVMSQFDVQRVYRSETGEPPWDEVTVPATYVPLVAGVTSYLFDDLAGEPSWYYAVSYFDTVSGTESSLSDPLIPGLSGYLEVEDIREEGFTDSMVTDAQIIRGIQRSSRMIDRITRQWFEPRTRTFHLDGKRGQDLLLEVPIIAVTNLSLVDYRGELDEIELGDVWIYNRHLTQGLMNPDDRHNPRISWRDLLPSSSTRARWSERRFVEGRRNIQIAGVFGYTEIDPLLTPGETESGSQIPSDYGDTPELIKLACTLLTIKQMYPKSTSDGDDFVVRARVIEQRTRDQMYQLADIPEADAAYGMTGDIEVDKILAMFMAPTAVGVV